MRIEGGVCLEGWIWRWECFVGEDVDDIWLDVAGWLLAVE